MAILMVFAGFAGMSGYNLQGLGFATQVKVCSSC